MIFNRFGIVYRKQFSIALDSLVQATFNSCDGFFKGLA